MALTAFNPELQPDFDLAQSFLDYLDPNTESWTFVCFHDNKDLPGRDKMIKTLYGSLHDNWQKLVRLNQRGYAICIMVNEAPVGYKEKESITKIRALFREIDDRDAIPTDEMPIPPSIIVRTSAPQHKRHEYWIVRHNAEDEIPTVHDSDSALRYLAHEYGGDKQTAESARKMRIPGFFHQKISEKKGLEGKPWLVTWKEYTGEEYSWDELKVEYTPREVVSLNAMLDEDEVQYLQPMEALKMHKALAVLDPDMGYDEWVKVGMALHHAGKISGDDYFSMWDHWSSYSGKYAGKEETRKHWRSFRDKKSEITKKTLFFMARQSEDDFEPQPEDVLHLINRYYSMLVSGGRVSILYERPDKAQSNGMVASFEILNPSDFRLMVKEYGWWGENKDGSPKFIQADDYWFRSPSRRVYHGVLFDPERVGHSRTVFNTFRGFPFIGSGKGECDLFLDHIYDNICSGDEYVYEWLIDWYADIIQNPERKPGTAIVMRGMEGTGKGVMARQGFGPLFGRHFKHLTSEAQLVGRFNAHLMDSLFIFADEMIWAGNHKNRGPLYSLISEDTLQVERKFQDIMNTPNYSRVCIATNESWAAPTTMTARRFLVLDVSELHRDDKPYFRRVIGDINHEKLMKMLIERKIEQDVGRAPRTEALVEQKILGAEGFDKWWLECLRTEMILGWHDTEWPEDITTTDMYNAYCAWCEMKKLRPDVGSSQGFGMKMKFIRHGAKSYQSRSKFSGKRYYHLLTPDRERELTRRVMLDAGRESGLN